MAETVRTLRGRGRRFQRPPPPLICTCHAKDEHHHALSCRLVIALTGRKFRNVRGMGRARIDRDDYTTPLPCALAICDRLSQLVLPKAAKGVRLIEPSAGSGNFVRAMQQTWPGAGAILAVEVHASYGAQLHATGASNIILARWQDQKQVMVPDLIVGNPPFTECEAHVFHALTLLPTGKSLAFLLPVTLLASQARAAKLWTPSAPGSLFGFGQLRYFWPLAERPSFTGDGNTDSTEYGVYVWVKGFTGRPEILPPLWWRTGVAA